MAPTPRVALPVWGEVEYLALRDAVARAAGAAAAVSPRVHGQVKAVTRTLLAGGFRPVDVAAVVDRVGVCSPMRLRAVLQGGHVDLPPRPAPELAPGPARVLVEQLVAALALDAEAPRRPVERDLEQEELEEQLRWQAEANRQQALFAGVRVSSVC